MDGQVVLVVSTVHPTFYLVVCSGGCRTRSCAVRPGSLGVDAVMRHRPAMRFSLQYILAHSATVQQSMCCAAPGMIGQNRVEQSVALCLIWLTGWHIHGHWLTGWRMPTASATMVGMVFEVCVYSHPFTHD